MNAGLLLDGLLGGEPRKVCGMRAEAGGNPGRGDSRLCWDGNGGVQMLYAVSHEIA
jgi:hypothetical protein